MYAGIRLMTAGGNEETVQEARATIKWALIGVIVVIGAFALSNFVVNRILRSTERPIQTNINAIQATIESCDIINCAANNIPQQNCLLGAVAMDGTVCCEWIPYHRSLENPPLGECRSLF